MFRAAPPGTAPYPRLPHAFLRDGGFVQTAQRPVRDGQIKRPEHAGHGTPFTVGEDGKFSIEFVECLASCGTAPVCMVNDDFYENVNKESAAEILQKYA